MPVQEAIAVEQPTHGIFSWPEQPRVKLGRTGAEPELSETEQQFQDMAHGFARDVLRPIGRQLDRMTPEQVIAPDSPYWEGGFGAASTASGSVLRRWFKSASTIS